MSWVLYNSRAPKLNDMKALNVTIIQAIPVINFAVKKFHICGYSTRTCSHSGIPGHKMSDRVIFIWV